MTNTNTPAGNISAAPRYKARWLTVCGFLMAMNTVLSSFNIPVPGGHFYLNDVIIVAAALSRPAGRVPGRRCRRIPGRFLFLPSLPMFVSLATHGLEAVVISPLLPGVTERRIFPSLSSCLLRRVHRGYRCLPRQGYVYSTPEYSLIKLFEILQAGIGAILGAFIWKNRNMGDTIQKIINKK